MLLNKSTSSLPNLYPETLYSFYPYPLTSRRTTHDTLKRSEDKSSLTPGPGPGPGPSSLLNQERRRRQRSQQAHELDRASKRALLGKRPAGIGGGRDAEDMSDEEKNLEEDKDGINKFGYRFLLPFGRRFTHMEIDQGPDNQQSPSPSEPDHERRQEDRNIGTPTSPLVGANNNNNVNPNATLDPDLDGDGASPAEEERDLDADIDDMDASDEDIQLDSTMEETADGIEPSGVNEGGEEQSMEEE